MKRLRSIAALACAAALLAALPALAPASVQVGSSGWQWGNPLPQGNTLRAISFAGAQRLRGGRLRNAAAHDRRRHDVERTAERHLHQPLRGAGHRPRRGLRRGGLRRAALERRRRHLQRVAFTPGRVELQRAVRRGLVHGRVHRLPRARPTAPSCAPTTTATPSPRRTRCPGTRARSGSATPADLRSYRSVGLAATSDGHIYRTVDGASSWTLVSTTTRAVRSFSFVDAQHGVAVGDGGLYLSPGTAARPGPRTISASAAATSAASAARPDECSDDEDRRPARAHRQRRGGAAARHAVARPGVRRGVRVADAHRRRRRDRRDRRLRRRGPTLRRRSAAGLPGASSGCARAVRPGRRSRRARTGRWRRPSTAARPGRAATSRPPRTCSTSRSRRTSPASRSTPRAACSARATAAPRGARSTPARPEPQAAVATSPTTVLLAGPLGLRRSTDGGDTFSAVGNRSVARAGLSAIDVAGSTLFAWGPRALFRSSDRGRTWPRPAAPAARPRARQGRLRRRADGLLAGTGRPLWRTRDGGRRGPSCSASARTTPRAWCGRARRAATSSSAASATSSTASGFLLRTTDAGATWHPQFVVSTPIPADGIATGRGGVDYLLGGDAGLLFSRSGGDAGRASR